MKISVIIPAYNEKEVLEECIESLGSQTLTNFEIIVIDDGSTDGTFEILTNLKKTLPDFRFERSSHLGAGAARNIGVKSARGEILVFVDSDMTFDRDFLAKLTASIEKGVVKGTFSKEEYVSNWDNTWARNWSINENWEKGKRHPANYPDHQPVFRAILRSEFERVGGFDPGGYDDDWSLSKKLGYEASLSSGAIFYHRNPASLAEVFNHAKWVGKRRYKLGIIGSLYALLRSSLPVSLVIGLYKSIVHAEPGFIIFKIVYDFGAFVGIITFLITKKGSK